MSAYIHKQTTPASTWTIQHNFGKMFVNIDVVIEYGDTIQTVLPENITLTNANTAVVTFSSNQVGEARVSV